MRKLRKAAACISTRRRSADDHAAGTPTQPPPRTLHGNLAELYDRWAAGEVDEAFCTAAYGDAPLGRLLWWQWVERDRDICALTKPLGSRLSLVRSHSANQEQSRRLLENEM